MPTFRNPRKACPERASRAEGVGQPWFRMGVQKGWASPAALPRVIRAAVARGLGRRAFYIRNSRILLVDRLRVIFLHHFPVGLGSKRIVGNHLDISGRY